jgi:hypothetical protein
VLAEVRRSLLPLLTDVHEPAQPRGRRSAMLQFRLRRQTDLLGHGAPAGR